MPRLTWSDLPPAVRSRVEGLLGGEVRATTSCLGGFSTSTAEIVTSATGRRLFVKAVREADNPGQIERNTTEARALDRIPAAAPVPALVGAFTEGDWFVLVTEAAPGATVPLPWTAQNLDAVLSALDALQDAATPCPVPDVPGVPELLGEDMRGFDRVAADPPPDLDLWLAAHLGELRAASARAIAALDGDTLCHSDLRADNIVLSPAGDVAIVDWACASRGARFADALQLISSVPDPDGALGLSARADAVMDRHGAPREVATDVLAGILGFFVDAARFPDRPPVVGLREHRIRRRDGLLPLVRERWERERSATPRRVYTHGYAAPVLVGHRRRTANNSAPHLLPHLREGQRLLDVGSGAGTITADLARIVGPENLTAIEVAEEAADLTRAELARQELPEVEVIVADAHALPFPDASIDVVHAHQVIQHVADPVRMLAEFRRVLRPGGIAAIRDADYPGFRWYPDDEALDRWLALYRRAAAANGGHPDAGRRLLAWAHAAGFHDVEAGAGTWCYATPEDRTWWGESWAARFTGTAIAEQILREGWAERADLDGIASAFRTWAADPDGWFLVPHGEVIARA